MNNIKFALSVITSLIVQCCQGQGESNSIKYDSLPVIYDYNQHLNVLDAVRCATYLFARNFTVKDSLGDIRVSLYYEKDTQETTPEIVNATSLAIFNIAYFYALAPIIESVKGAYQFLVVNAYDKNGKIIYHENYPIKQYKPYHTKDYMATIFERLRVPNTWTIRDKMYVITYYCMDSTERGLFRNPLLLILTKLKLLRPDCTKWKEYYPECADTEMCETSIIKLTK